MQHTQGLRRAATQERNRTATVYRGRRRSYGEIVERVARTHNGRLDLLPRPGGGLCARLILSNSEITSK